MMASSIFADNVLSPFLDANGLFRPTEKAFVDRGMMYKDSNMTRHAWNRGIVIVMVNTPSRCFGALLIVVVSSPRHVPSEGEFCVFFYF